MAVVVVVRGTAVAGRAVAVAVADRARDGRVVADPAAPAAAPVVVAPAGPLLHTAAAPPSADSSDTKGSWA